MPHDEPVSGGSGAELPLGNDFSALGLARPYQSATALVVLVLPSSSHDPLWSAVQ